MTVDRDDRAILDEERIGHENCTRIGVTPFLDGESAFRPAINRRVDHRVKGMADGFVRRDVDGPVRVEDAFLHLISREPHGFWLDDSLGETVSYLGLGTPVAVTDGFTELESANDVPVSRVGWISYGERESTLVEWPSPEPRTANWRDSPEEYAGFIDECLRHITDGDSYQLCLTTSIDVPGDIDPVGTYIALRRASPTRHGGYIHSGDVYLLSSSPETFLTVRGRVASTKPIKGTRARSLDPAEDALLKRELLDSDKERAENLMIVDLCRNDLSKVCETGSVHVPALHVVETYSTVHQLVSTVSGTLADGVTASRAAAALFPAGSMTGAPKRRAVEILNGLETGERGMYSGVFGFAGRGDLTLAMTIRSIVIDDRGATIGVGGGITAGSDPRAEIREVGVKADALLRVLGASPNSYLSAE